MSAFHCRPLGSLNRTRLSNLFNVTSPEVVDYGFPPPLVECSTPLLLFYQYLTLILLYTNLLLLLAPLLKNLVLKIIVRTVFLKAWLPQQQHQPRHHHHHQAGVISSVSSSSFPPTSSCNNNNNNNNTDNTLSRSQPKSCKHLKFESVPGDIFSSSSSSTTAATSTSSSSNNSTSTYHLGRQLRASSNYHYPSSVEIITQVNYLLLLLAYLATFLENVILRTKLATGAFGLVVHTNLSTLELLADGFSLLVFVVEYGCFYHELWLSSSAEVVANSNSYHRPQHYDQSSVRYQSLLNTIAFIYFGFSALCSLAKLVMVVMISAVASISPFYLLKPYVLVAMFFFQGFFAFKHLNHLFKINSNSVKHQALPPKLSQIKYRREWCNFLSKITFHWFFAILSMGAQRKLELNDLGALPEKEYSTFQYERFRQHYDTTDMSKHSKSFLWLVILKTYKKTLVLGALIKIVSDLSSLVGPVSLSYILNYISAYQSGELAHQAWANSSLYVFGAGDQLGFAQLGVAEFFQNAYIVAVIVFVATLVQSTCSNNFNHLMVSEGIHLKTALNCAIFHKVLRMPFTSAIDMGAISNYMTTDSGNIFQFFIMKHYLWAVPIKLATLLYLLHQQMGVSALLGASLFFVSIPFQYCCTHQLSKLQKAQMDEADKRVSKTSELFMGIKLLKLLGWDLQFAKQIKVIRERELGHLKKDAIYVGINTFLTQGTAILVTFVTFVVYTYVEQRPLNASIVFTSIALFNQISTPLYILPVVIPMLLAALNSHKRLMCLLSMSEVRNDSIEWREVLNAKTIGAEPASAPIVVGEGHTTAAAAAALHKSLDRSHSAATPDFVKPLKHQNTVDGSGSNLAVASPHYDLTCSISEAKFAWYDEDVCGKVAEKVETDNCTLANISVRIPRSRLTILVGSIGGGKSAFLYSLIGELRMLSGRLLWLNENRDGFGYVPSAPWILNISVQENIIFGNPFDRKRYDEVVSRCCLQADIDLLPFGDQTIMGERGINLSGGQKQRICLARALYSPAATLILDDAFSALDPIVGYSVFESAILRWAIKQQRRTVILATHKHDFLLKADYVIVLESGCIKNAGPLAQIQKEDKAFFYQWDVIKEKEKLEQRGQLPQNCKTTTERMKLVRMLSKKQEYRGSHSVKRDRHTSIRKPSPLVRQMSYDTNALTCHEYAETCDITVIQESELEALSPPALSNSATPGNNNNNNPLSESEQSKQSYLSLTSNSFDASRNNSAISRAPTFSRLNSRMSNYSNQATSIMEEDELEEGETLDEMSSSLRDELVTGDEDSDDSPIEDKTNEMISEMVSEINTFNENQATSNAVYHDLGTGSRTLHISWSVYRTYIKAHSYLLATLVVVGFAFNQVLKIGSDFWLTQWTRDAELKGHSNSSHAKSPGQQRADLLFYIQVYAILSLVSVIFSVLQLISAQLIAIRAVRLLHDNLLDRLVNASLLFFDKTPIGRILNRFTNDINVVDKKLPIAIPVLLRFFFLCLSGILINIYITPFFMLAILPILVVYYYIQKMFRSTSLQLQRLELSSKSPILSHFNMTLDGITSIRAYRETDKFIDKFFQLLDINNLCFLLVNSSNCAMGVALDYLGGVILFTATFTSISAALYWDVSAAFVGFSLTGTLLIPVYLNWLVKNFASVEMNMSSVERILQYSHVPSEESCYNRLAPLQQDDADHRDGLEHWPSKGEIEFQSVSIRYETCFEPIVRNASFKIQPGEKIGICGRTGSGKSSLIGAIFKINQVCGGNIFIDGVNIDKVCLHKIRKRLSIIPQDAVLFNGTIRDNLDPHEESTDEQIWTVLKDFHLTKQIRDLREEIGDETRYSSGERQLLCCARAFLRRSPVLIMDESCANLDQRTERLVMKQILQSRRTIILIAHNIRNIVNFDRVLVVDKGRVVEFDQPSRLMDNPNSIFYALYHRKYRS